MRHHRIVLRRHGGPEVLEVLEEERPQPKSGEVRIRVQAAGISAHDLMTRRTGAIPGTPKPPFTLGLDAVGVIDAVGDDVQGLTVGETVAVGTYTLGYGSYAEYLCIPAEAVVHVPDDVDPTQAVCLVVNYLTAHTMLHHAAHIQRGQRVLIHGAAGGVGSAMLDLGRNLGLEMYGTALPENHDYVRSFGAIPIDYTTANFVTRIRELTGDGVDAAFDPIGGGRQLWRSYRSLRAGGTLVWYGVAGSQAHGSWLIVGSVLTRLLLSLIPDGKKAPNPPDAADYASETLPELMRLLAQGHIHPVVADRFPLLEARRAHERMEEGGYEGKIVLIPTVQDPQQPHREHP